MDSGIGSPTSCSFEVFENCGLYRADSAGVGSVREDGVDHRVHTNTATRASDR